MTEIEKVIKLFEKTKIKKGWFVYYSEVTKENDISRMTSKRARLVQIMNYKIKTSKSGFVTHKISFYDDITKRRSNRNVRLDLNNLEKNAWSFSLNKKRSESDHDKILENVLEKYRLELKKAEEKIDGFRGGF